MLINYLSWRIQRWKKDWEMDNHEFVQKQNYGKYKSIQVREVIMINKMVSKLEIGQSFIINLMRKVFLQSNLLVNIIMKKKTGYWQMLSIDCNIIIGGCKYDEDTGLKTGRWVKLYEHFYRFQSQLLYYKYSYCIYWRVQKWCEIGIFQIGRIEIDMKLQDNMMIIKLNNINSTFYISQYQSKLQQIFFLFYQLSPNF